MLVDEAQRTRLRRNCIYLRYREAKVLEERRAGG